MTPLRKTIGAVVLAFSGAFTHASGLFDPPPQSPESQTETKCRAYSRTVRQLGKTLTEVEPALWGTPVAVDLRTLDDCGRDTLRKIVERTIEGQERIAQSRLLTVENVARGNEKAKEIIARQVTDGRLRAILESYHAFLNGDNTAMDKPKAKEAIHVWAEERKAAILEAMDKIYQGNSNTPAAVKPLPLALS